MNSLEYVILKIMKRAKTKKNPEYDQSADAPKKFERTMIALFRAPKVTSEKAKERQGLGRFSLAFELHAASGQTYREVVSEYRTPPGLGD